MHLHLPSLSGRGGGGQPLGQLRQTALMPDAESPQRSDHSRALAEPVFIGDEYRPFGELGPADARRLSSQLRSAGGWGPMSKVGSVAIGWGELAKLLEAEGAGTVSELDPTVVVEFARRVWVLPPLGGFL